MRILSQAPSLSAAFQDRIEARINTQIQEINSRLDNGLLSIVAGIGFEFDRARKQVKGNMGEWGVSLLLHSLSDEWVMFRNALIPTNKSGALTEIDIIIIGKNGIFLIEVKNWSGSFSAYKDKWKRRQGNNWIAIESSPTMQSNYHRKMFERWITPIVPNLPDRFVIAPVIFPTAKWLGVKDCSAPVLENINALLSMINNSPECLNSTQTFSISEAIKDYKNGEF
jgi:Nuclease-related domain